MLYTVNKGSSGCLRHRRLRRGAGTTEMSVLPDWTSRSERLPIYPKFQVASRAAAVRGIMCGATRSCAWKDMDAASLGERRVDRLPSHSGGANACGAHGAREEAADIFRL